MRLRDATRADVPALLALNAESVEMLSPLDAGRLERPAAAAAYLRVVERGQGAVAGFLLGFGPRADYDRPNCCWFDAGLTAAQLRSKFRVVGT